MIGAIGNQAMAAEARGAGKSAEAVGQKAKAIVAVAREANFEVPRNAQGLAASAVARGIDPASLFAGQVSDGVDVPDIAAPDAPDGDSVAQDAAAIMSDEAAVTGFAAKAELVISEDPSAALLQGDAEDEGSRG